jgi:FeS assembly SUF system protein
MDDASRTALAADDLDPTDVDAARAAAVPAEGTAASLDAVAQTPDHALTTATGAEAPSAIPQAELDRLTDELIGALKTVFDPEIPVDIYELGLIYKVDVSDDRDVIVDMTLTAPGCPVAGDMPGWVEEAVRKIDGVRSARANLTFDPPWDPSMMSDEAKLQLNMF